MCCVYRKVTGYTAGSCHPWIKRCDVKTSTHTTAAVSRKVEYDASKQYSDSCILCFGERSRPSDRKDTEIRAREAGNGHLFFWRRLKQETRLITLYDARLVTTTIPTTEKKKKNARQLHLFDVKTTGACVVPTDHKQT